MTETDDQPTDHGDEGGNDGPSRRQFLGTTAAAGALAGLGGLDIDGVALQGDGEQRFFERGTEVGAQMMADGPLTAPTDFAAGEDGRWYVTDQTGELYAGTDDGLEPEPLVDVSDRMVELGTFYGLYADPNQDYDERGLLGVELHPEFAENRRLYLHYSAPPTDELRSINWDHVEVVSEFQASDDATSVDPDSERQLLRIPSPQYNHDSGPMAFGPDGYLYVPMGDGGGANDNMYGHVPDWYARNTGGNGQDVRTNLMGDILRIDVDSAGEDTAYGIPDDNPFVDTEVARDEIYAYGFRNPFGISFDSEGNMFVADAGQNLWEEVSVVEAGGNHGWNVKEGTHCFSTEQPSDPEAITDCPGQAPSEAPFDGDELIDPIAEYPHVYRGTQVGIVVVGGHRYEQSTIADLQGKYVFGDWSADPARQEPAGRVFAATPPDDFGGAAAGNETNVTDENVTAENVTADNETNVTAANETDNVSAGNDTDDASIAADLQGNDTGNETNETGEKAPVGNETGNATAGNETNQTAGPSEQVVPRDQLWDMEELVFAGSEDGSLGWFVRQFGRGQDGEIYVLVNQRGIPEGDTGAVLKLVPSGEGGAARMDATAAAGNETNATQGGGEPGNATAENATNETVGNETGNETGNVTGNASQ
jgi:glucose/arabinose dehydrogenase